MSVLSSMCYMSEPSNTNNIWLALAFMPFGLFFDFMDGRVARWRKKSSLMGQELDSLADLVCTSLRRSSPHSVNTELTRVSFLLLHIDLLWCCTSFGGIWYWNPNLHRSPLPKLLRSLWSDKTRSLQRDGCGGTKG